MTKDIILYHSSTQTVYRKTTIDKVFIREIPLKKTKNKPVEILFITSFPPRECGIATYSQDLINALNNQFSSGFNNTICALESDTEKHVYKQSPKFILNTDQRNSFTKTAISINMDDSIKLVVMQHEFGFFVNNESDFKVFFEHISKPIVFVFHTVLPKPNDDMKKKVQDMAIVASSVVVMTKNAAIILEKEYYIPTNKISVIPHGTHLVPPTDKNKLKKKFELSGKKVLSTFGLLSSSKNIETSLNALPSIVENHKNVMFLILGKTHPTVVKHEGELYREMLEEKVKELKIEKHVRFVNEYLPLPILLEYLLLTDIYLFTSKDPNQAVSGTFSYAVSCGCPVVSTRIPHAKEVLNNNNGILIDFENADQLSNAVVSLLNNKKLRNEISSNSLHKMASTSWQNAAIAHALLFKKLTSNAFQLNYRIPSLNLNHIRKMTTDIGMIQFSKMANPDFHSGYTLDDNARALIAICQQYELHQNEEDLLLIKKYLLFIHHCFQPNGKFLNYVNENEGFTPQNYFENLEDSNGRAMWALGYVISLKHLLPINLFCDAEILFQKALLHLNIIHSTRAMAFIIKGLYYQNKTENLYLIKVFANRLMQMYKHEQSEQWHWYENYLTYGNSLLPEAMLCAYLRTRNEEYKRIASESFGFLLSKIFVDGKIKVISNKGWHIKDRVSESVVGGEQPIDVAYTVMALERFYNVLKNDDYKQKAIVAFNWFLGENHLHQIVYNPCTGGCYDGIEEFNVNLNQGAESSLSYLMARLAIERIHGVKKMDLNADRYAVCLG